MEELNEDRFEDALIKMISETRTGQIQWRAVPGAASSDSRMSFESSVNGRKLTVYRTLDDFYGLMLDQGSESAYLFPEHVGIEDLFDSAARQNAKANADVNRFLEAFLAGAR